MLVRFKQFFSALNADITLKEHKLVETLLNQREQGLFYGMDVIDQRHSLDVLRTCQDFVEQEGRHINTQVLLKAALLHDVGKRAGDLTLWARVYVVMARRLMPKLFYSLAKRPGNPCYISLHHPEISAARCEGAGCGEDLVRLVSLHQAGGSGFELELLIKADKLN